MIDEDVNHAAPIERLHLPAPEPDQHHHQFKLDPISDPLRVGDRVHRSCGTFVTG